MTIGRRRTSVSLEAHFWDGLSEICRREAIGIDALCTAVDGQRLRSSMSSSLRVFLLLYFRALADAMQSRHADPRPAGHGHLRTVMDDFGAFERNSRAA